MPDLNKELDHLKALSDKLNELQAQIDEMSKKASVISNARTG
ncbi:MAG: hypothetical protein ABIK61_07470 [candidate division WOR-3 bacterium]